MDNLFSQYIQYGEGLAINHPLIRHSQTPGQIAFDVISQQDVESERRDGIFRTAAQPKGFFLRWVVFNGDLDDFAQNAQGMKTLRGGFYIVKKHSQREKGKDSWVTALLDSYEVGMQICARMVRDSQNGHPLFMRSVDRLDKLKPLWSPRVELGEAKDMTGWLFTFNFNNAIVNCAAVQATEWLDI